LHKFFVNNAMAQLEDWSEFPRPRGTLVPVCCDDGPARTVLSRTLEANIMKTTNLATTYGLKLDERTQGETRESAFRNPLWTRAGSSPDASRLAGLFMLVLLSGMPSASCLLYAAGTQSEAGVQEATASSAQVSNKSANAVEYSVVKIFAT